MRKLALASLAVLAACSEGGGDPAEKKESAQAALKMQPGQWETTVEVTEMAMADKSMPKMKGGQKTTVSSCVTAEQVEQPGAAVFGATKGDCKYDNFYMRNGRLNASMSCKQAGVPGTMNSTVDGTYSADSFETNVTTNTYTGGADFKMSAKVTGKRVSATCTAEGDGKAT
jgi:hypothetical protein